LTDDAIRGAQLRQKQVSGELLTPVERGRFLVKNYPKDGEYRRIKLTSQIADKLRAYAHDRRLADDDVLFTMPTPEPVLTMLPDPDLLGHTSPNAGGQTYRHGTLSAVRGP
jgi:hypothetical protein